MNKQAIEAISTMAAYLLREDSECSGETAAQASAHAIYALGGSTDDIQDMGKGVLQILSEKLSDEQLETVHGLTGGKYK